MQIDNSKSTSAYVKDIVLHDKSCQKKQTIPRKKSLFMKINNKEHVQETSQTNNNITDTNVNNTINENQTSTTKPQISDDSLKIQTQYYKIIEQLYFLIQQARSSFVTTSNTAFNVLNNIYNNLNNQVFVDTLTNEKIIIDQDLVIILLKQFHQLPNIKYLADKQGQNEENFVSSNSVLEVIYLQLSQDRKHKQQYTAPLNLLCSIILQDDGYLLEQMNLHENIDKIIPIAEFQVSLLQLQLIDKMIPLLNTNLDDQEKIAIYLILERMLIGTTSQQVDIINRKFLIKLFEDDMEFQIRDLKEKGYFVTTGRIVLRTLTALKIYVNDQEVISILINNFFQLTNENNNQPEKNQNTNKQNEIMQLILLFVNNYTIYHDKNSNIEQQIQDAALFIEEFIINNITQFEVNLTDCIAKIIYLLSKYQKFNDLVDKFKNSLKNEQKLNNVQLSQYPFILYYNESYTGAQMQQSQIQQNINHYQQYFDEIGLNKIQLSDQQIIQFHLTQFFDMDIQISLQAVYNNIFTKQFSLLEICKKFNQILNCKEQINEDNIQKLSNYQIIYRFVNQDEYLVQIIKQLMQSQTGLQKFQIQLINNYFESKSGLNPYQTFQLILELSQQEVQLQLTSQQSNFIIEQIQNLQNQTILTNTLTFRLLKDSFNLFVSQLQVNDCYLCKELVMLYQSYDNTLNNNKFVQIWEKRLKQLNKNSK